MVFKGAGSDSGAGVEGARGAGAQGVGMEEAGGAGASAEGLRAA
jgi:hypothetical protein